MFRTIGHTFGLMKMSWGVLMMDRELIFFPVFSAIGLLLLIVAFGGIQLTLGGDTAQGVAYVVFIVLAYIIITFFNAALISAALERLRGGDPDVSSGMAHAMKHVHQIILWALVSAAVTLILMAIRSMERRIPLAGLLTRLIGGVWEFLTFFVVPVMVTENLGPIAGIKRSVSIVRETWGRQITASFGFMLFYVVALVVAVIPGVVVGLVNVPAGVILGVALGGVAIAAVQATEGIFKAALYDYAVGEQPQGFDLPTLQTAFRPA